MKDADFGVKSRFFYIVSCLLGMIITYYIRDTTYSQISNYKGCKKLFDLPWFFTLVMTIAMSSCMIVYLILVKINPMHGPKFKNIQMQMYFIPIIPSVCDLFASMFYSFSLVNNKGKISTALRYFELFSIVIMRTLLFESINYSFRWFSLGIIFLGIFFVVFSVISDENKEGSVKAFPIILQIISQILYATKSIFEEKILHNNDLSPWWLMGVEGVYGFFINLFIVYPIVYVIPLNKNTKGIHENFCESIYMAFHSKAVIALIFIYIPFSCLYNGSIGGTIQTTNSINYTIVEMIASSLAWIVDLIIYYGFKGKYIIPCYNEDFKSITKGIQWTKLSWMRLIGSIIFLFGELTYIGIIKFSFFRYPDSNVKIITLNEVLIKDHDT